MKKFFYIAALFAALGFAPRAQASDIFVAATSAGANNGTSCANARAYTTLGAGEYAGNRIRICGTITVPTNTTGFTVGGDNTTIKFENNAILQSQAFPYPTGGAIDCAGHNHVTIDGGGTTVPTRGAPVDAGLIRNTNNGDLLTFHQNSAAINCGTSGASNLTVQNLRIANIYVKVQNNVSQNGDTTLGIFGGGSNTLITHNTLDHTRYPIYDPYSPAGMTNVEISFNSETFIEVCSVIGDTSGGATFTGTAKYHDNFCGGGNYLWDQGTASDNNFHHNGIHWWRTQPGSTFAGIQIYRNDFIGCFGQDVAYANGQGGLTHITAIIFLESVGDGAIIANNFIDVTACAPQTGYPNGLNFGDNGQIELKLSETASESTRNAIVVNNTILSNQGKCAETDSTGTVWKNNICTGPATGSGVFALYTPNGTNTTTVTASNNDYFHINTWGNFDTFSSWQAKVGDGGSTTGDPKLNSLYVPQTGSVAIGGGVNLSTLGAIVSTDHAGNVRPTTGSWDMGAIQASSGGAAPAITFTTSPLAFPNQVVLTTSSALTETFTNSGTAALVLSTPFFTVSGDFAEVTGGSCSNGLTVAVSGTCTVQITFTPSVTGARTGTLQINGNASSSVGLTGTGTGGSLSFSVMAFPNQVQFTTSTALTETVTNTGSANVTLANPYFSVTDPSDAVDFVVVTGAGAGTCAVGTVLAPGGSCTVKVTFTPHTQAAESAHLNIFGNTANGFVNMTGTGTAPTAPAITFNPNPPTLAFGSKTVGTTTAALTLTVINSGNANLILGSPYSTLSGANATEFSNLGTGTCSNGLSIIPAASCTIKLAFSPITAGAKSAAITINSNAAGTNSATLTGTGTAGAAHMTVAPPSLGFPDQTKNTTSAPLTLTIGNDGTATLILSTPYFVKSGAFAADYAIAAGTTCSDALNIVSGGSCVIKVTFSPTTNNNETATLAVNSTIASNVSVALSGLGIFPTAVFTPPQPLAFGNQTQSVASSARTLTLTNTGNGNLVIGNTPFITKSGANPGDFAITGGTCAALASIAPGASCTILVVFTPTNLGSEGATFTLVANAVTSETLTGTGVAAVTPALSVSPPVTTYATTTVGATTAGQTLTFLNSGNTTLTLSTPFFTKAGTNPGDFARSAGSCTDGATLTQGSTCTLIITFTPTAAGARSATIVGNATTATAPSVSLQGTGQATTVILALTPSPRFFLDTTVGATSASVTLTLTNSGTGTATLGTPYFTKTTGTPGDFTVTGGTCIDGGSVGPASTCTITMTFSPSITAGGTETTLLTVSTTGVATAADTLQGQGIPVATQPAPTPKTILISADFMHLEIDGTDFVPSVTKIYVNDIALPTVCTPTICTATTSSSMVLLPLLLGTSLKLELR